LMHPQGEPNVKRQIKRCK